jgi:hypothetical protein
MPRIFTLSLVAVATVALSIAACGAHPQARAAAPADPPVFGDAFWKFWGDGRAELAGYDLTFRRYGELRKGVAVTIFVTETFSNSLRVKADPGKHPKSDEFPVLKLNLVEDFSTGIYDYNLMTSAFVALTPVNGRPAGSLTKVSFSSQEWCGNVYAHLLFDAAQARLTSHSYFDGEADLSRTLSVPSDALSADAILLWARGLAAPWLAPGERRTVALLRSLETARLEHRPVEMLRATLSRAAAPSRASAPAGTFDVELRRVEIEGGPSWTVAVEGAEPHRIIGWETNEGQKASLLGSERLQYWKLNAPGGESALAKLGLTPRAARMP